MNKLVPTSFIKYLEEIKMELDDSFGVPIVIDNFVGNYCLIELTKGVKLAISKSEVMHSAWLD